VPQSPGENTEYRVPSSWWAAVEPLLASLYEESQAPGWGVPRERFAAALERSVSRRFAEGGLSQERLEEYLHTLYAEDLALACACMAGEERAWEYFVREYQGYLRAAAGAITKGSRAGADGQELADSLFAELFGLADGQRGERSLLRYFHGRSSLKTWLRTILSQRHVDCIRRSRRWQSYEGENGEEMKWPPGERIGQPILDPHRERYVTRFVNALECSLAGLERNDRLRLELYYARQFTLAEIGKKLGEHESSVSRNLERIRRDLRGSIETFLKAPPPLSEPEIALCFQYAAEDSPIDFRKLFPNKESERPGAGRKETS
jgi:RNA polymerase sigma-70 factor